uniref:Uncharacterized protein MANES_06G152500 n=1 Tax=Rhizophora mucronata TaxID=61149 RepID=A0A2P2LB73_RHIMU
MAPNKLVKRKPGRRFNSAEPNFPMASSATSIFNYNRVAVLTTIVAVLGVVVLLGISSNVRSVLVTVDPTPKIHAIQVLNEFPHDPKAFTQGLLYAGNDKLFESTGLYGQSSVRRVALQTGKVEIIQMMDSSYFGEGLTLLGDRFAS